MGDDPSLDTLRYGALQTQLVQLNERGRHYGGQLWKLPFAYVSMVGAVLALTKETIAVETPSILFPALGTLGLVVTCMVLATATSLAKAVDAIQSTETALGLTQTAGHRPLLNALYVGLALLVAGFCFWWGEREVAHAVSLVGVGLAAFTAGSLTECARARRRAQKGGRS